MLEHVDWSVFQSDLWFNTDAYPDRKEHRMAEFLVYKKVEFVDFPYIVTYNDEALALVSNAINNINDNIKVVLRPNFYFYP